MMQWLKITRLTVKHRLSITGAAVIITTCHLQNDAVHNGSLVTLIDLTKDSETTHHLPVGATLWKYDCHNK